MSTTNPDQEMTDAQTRPAAQVLASTEPNSAEDAIIISSGESSGSMDIDTEEIPPMRKPTPRALTTERDQTLPVPKSSADDDRTKYEDRGRYPELRACLRETIKSVQEANRETRKLLDQQAKDAEGMIAARAIIDRLLEAKRAQKQKDLGAAAAAEAEAQAREKRMAEAVEMETEVPQVGDDFTTPTRDKTVDEHMSGLSVRTQVPGRTLTPDVQKWLDSLTAAELQKIKRRHSEDSKFSTEHDKKKKYHAKNLGKVDENTFDDLSEYSGSEPETSAAGASRKPSRRTSTMDFFGRNFELVGSKLNLFTSSAAVPSIAEPTNTADPSSARIRDIRAWDEDGGVFVPVDDLVPQGEGHDEIMAVVNKIDTDNKQRLQAWFRSCQNRGVDPLDEPHCLTCRCINLKNPACETEGYTSDHHACNVCVHQKQNHPCCRLYKESGKYYIGFLPLEPDSRGAVGPAAKAYWVAQKVKKGKFAKAKQLVLNKGKQPAVM